MKPGLLFYLLAFCLPLSLRAEGNGSHLDGGGEPEFGRERSISREIENQERVGPGLEGRLSFHLLPSRGLGAPSVERYLELSQIHYTWSFGSVLAGLGCWVTIVAPPPERAIRFPTGHLRPHGFSGNSFGPALRQMNRGTSFLEQAGGWMFEGAAFISGIRYINSAWFSFDSSVGEGEVECKGHNSTGDRPITLGDLRRVMGSHFGFALH